MEPSTRFTEHSFEFFSELAQNNNRDWFHSNRNRFKSDLETPFVAFLETISHKLSATAMPLRGGRKTMFRMQRDVRFSNNKRPYNESISGLLTMTGTKNGSGRLAYIAIDKDGGRIGGGMHQPTSTQLGPVRRRILNEPETFSTVLDVLSDSEIEIEDGSDRKVKTVPRGFAGAEEHEYVDFIRLKQILAFRSLPVPSLIDGSAVDLVVQAIYALRYLYDFIDGARNDYY